MSIWGFFFQGRGNCLQREEWQRNIPVQRLAASLATPENFPIKFDSKWVGCLVSLPADENLLFEFALGYILCASRSVGSLSAYCFNSFWRFRSSASAAASCTINSWRSLYVVKGKDRAHLLTLDTNNEIPEEARHSTYAILSTSACIMKLSLQFPIWGFQSLKLFPQTHQFCVFLRCCWGRHISSDKRPEAIGQRFEVPWLTVCWTALGKDQ